VVGTSTLEKKNKDLNRATRELEAKMRNLQQRTENDKVTNHNIKYIRINCLCTGGECYVTYIFRFISNKFWNWGEGRGGFT
jgi:hypothetical protein